MWQIPVDSVIYYVTYINNLLVYLYENIVLIILGMIDFISISLAVYISKKNKENINFNGTKNSDIYNVFSNYITTKEYPPYAVMINGGWGVGKTYFINEFVKSVNKYDIDILYISLHGKEKISDVKDEVKDKSYKKDYAILGLKILIQTINVTPLNDLSEKFGLKKLLTDNIYKMNVFNIWDIVIVDDLERSKIDINSIFGYFNEFIINNTLVVFSCNEKVILCKDNKTVPKNFEDYIVSKEKMINSTFLLKPEVDNVIKTQVNKYSNYWEVSLSTSKINVSIEDIEKIIRDAINVMNLKNMRTVEAMLYDYNLLLSKLCLCLEEVSNADEKDCVEEYLKRFTWNYFIVYMVYKSHSNLDEMNDIHYILKQNILNETSWELLICDSYFLDTVWFKGEIYSGYNQFKVIFKRQDILYKIHNALDMNKNDGNISEENIKKMIDNFENGKYNTIEDIYTYIEVYYSLLKFEILPNGYNISQLVKEIEAFVKNNIDEIDFKNYKWKMSFSNLEDDRIRDLLKELYKIGIDKSYSMLNKKVIFFNMINLDKPLRQINEELYNIDKFTAQDIFEWLSEDKNEEKFIDLCNTIFYIGIDPVGHDFSAEMDYIIKWELKLKEIRELYVDKSQNMKHKYTIEWIKYDEMAKELDDILFHLDAIKDKEGKNDGRKR